MTEHRSAVVWHRDKSVRHPRLLDLFCGAGGAAMGYFRAGFTVIGVDVHPQPNYPFDFWQADALTFPWALMGEGRGWDFDVIHASPPCQQYSDLRHRTGKEYPDLVAATRELLIDAGTPYVIENVESAPLTDPVILCGTMFPALRVLRHRGFESCVKLTAPAHGNHPLVFTHDKRKSHYGKLDQDKSFVQVTGGGNSTTKRAKQAMGVNWKMSKEEINEAIPPAYTEYIGIQLREQLGI